MLHNQAFNRIKHVIHIHRLTTKTVNTDVPLKEGEQHASADISHCSPICNNSLNAPACHAAAFNPYLVDVG